MHISRKIPFMLVIFLTLISLAGCGSVQIVAPPTTRLRRWDQDIDFLQENLPQKHINLYHNITKSEFDHEIADLKKDLPNLRDYQIKCRLAQIIASVGDAHTALYLFPDSNEDNVYPIILSWFGSDLMVIGEDPKYRELFGKRLLSINNVPVNQITSKINTLISHENDQWLRNINASYITLPTVLKFFNITTGGKAEFTFADNKGNIEKVSLAPENMAPYLLQRPENYLLSDKLLQPDPKDPGSRLYWYEYIPADKILYFQYNQCEDRNTAKMMGDKNWQSLPDFGQFSTQLINAINNDNINKLIVDLRCNTGGDSGLMAQLATKLSKIGKLQGKGKVFIIIGKGTFSSGVWAAVDMKVNFPQADLCGEPTGGNVSGYGEVGTITLPNSQLSVSYCKKYFPSYHGYTGQLVPDLIIKQSFTDYAKGIDDAYKAITDYHG